MGKEIIRDGRKNELRDSSVLQSLVVLSSQILYE